MRHTILFISLAANQSRFFASLEPLIRKADKDVVHVCFHEGAARELDKAGHRVFNPFRLPHQNDLASLDDYNIGNPALLIGHEKAAYEIFDSEGLLQKFRRHLASLEMIFETLQNEDRNIVVVQELGGFTSVLAAYFVAQRRRIPNYFIEPSFFKGRFFLTVNSFAAPKIIQRFDYAEDTMKDRLSHIRNNQTVVIPTKDKLHYRGAIHKILDRKNWQRLLEKLFQKYWLGEKEEFQHIGGHVSRHIRMSLNAARLRRDYQEMPDGVPFIYYPLHVPADFALTIRSPEYLDQLSLIDFLCRIAPVDHKVVIKEHPALIGALSASRVRGLLRRHDNLVLLSPDINNHQLLRTADMVVTVNSKAGAEALLYGRRVFALGDSFYRDSGLVIPIGALGDLPRELATTIQPNQDKVDHFLQSVWNASLGGELYDLREENINEFSSSLLSALGVRDPESGRT